MLSGNEQLLLLLTTPLYTVLILIEIVMSYFHNKNYYTLKDTLTNIYLSGLNAGLDILFRAFSVVVLLFFGNYSPINWDYGVAYWLTLFLIEDFAFYLLHCVDHYCRLFWAVHVTHHSSEYFNLTTGFRSSVFQPLYRFLYFIPLALLGFRPMDIALMYAITQIYGILVHTRYLGKLAVLEWVFVTPSHHRVHHASNLAYLDKNMGMCLIIWDRLFGTFQEELPQEPVRFGLTKDVENKNPVNIVFHEWRNMLNDIWRAPSWKIALKYIFYPPGWSHDGSYNTTKELQQKV